MKIKTLLAFSLVLTVSALARGAEAPPAIKMMIDIPEAWRDGKLELPRALYPANPNGHFFVVLENVSSQPIFLWDHNGGLKDLSFEIIGGDRKAIEVRRNWGPETVTFDYQLRLGPGEATVVEIRFKSTSSPSYGGGYPFPLPALGAGRQVSLRAKFETSDTPGKGFWTGKVFSEPLDGRLKDQGG